MEPLPPSLAARWPELAAIRLRRGGIFPRIAGWPLLQRTVTAVTLWRWVFLGAEATIHPELLLHELRHLQQFEANRSFPLRYLWESVRRGYHQNQYEVDARAWAARMLGTDASISPSED